jgi:hypothetical protein
MTNMYTAIPVILYKKVENKEVQIALFRHMTEAKEWSIQNGIMNRGWVRQSLRLNDYPTMRISSKKFPNTNQYRFEFAPKREYPEELYTVAIESNDVSKPLQTKKPPKFVLYHKVNGEEKLIEKFITIKECNEYAVKNGIMNVGLLKASIKSNSYLTPTYNSKKYPYSYKYRFSSINNET